MTREQHIFVVDDDPDIRELLSDYLRRHGFATSSAGDAREFFRLLPGTPCDLVVLDIMLPGADGYETFRRLRAFSAVPVIFLTALGDITNRVVGLELGADDYLAKPFGVMEMVSRVKAVLRRCHPADTGHVLSAGGLSMDLDCRTVTVDGQRLQLTYKEFELLRLFLSHPGMAFTRDQLFNDVWGADYVGESRTVDMHIRTLRQKLGPCGGHIATVRGVGYRWEEKS